MAEDQNKQNSKINPDLTKKISLNIMFLVFNLILLSAFFFQIYQVSKIYSEKSKNAINNGRKVIVNAKTNKTDSLKMSENDIRTLNPNHKDRVEAVLAELVGDDFIGPRESEKAKTVDYTKGNLSIIVTEIGQTQHGLDTASKLPKEVAFAFSPYSDDLQNKIKKATSDGRQVLINLIFEPSGFPLKDSGPLTVLTSSDPASNTAKLEKTLGELTDYTGFLTNSSEIFTHNFEIASPILNKIKEFGKFFGYYRVAANSYLENEVKPMALDVIIVDYLIDEKLSRQDIRKKLNLAKQDIISKNKKIIVALRPYKISVKELESWMKDNVDSQNISLAPINYFVINN